MARRRSGTAGIFVSTVALTGILAALGHLDHYVPSGRTGHYDYYNPRTMAPRAELILPHETAVNAAPLDNPEQRSQYEAEQRKTVLELQPYRRSETATILGEGRTGKATLVNLNPNINSWLLLTIEWSGGGRSAYHLENPDPIGQHIHLVDGQSGLMVTTATASGPCEMWMGKPTAIEKAVISALPYGALCGGKLYVRNRVAGHFTDLERMTDFLREDVWNGDDIVGFVRENFYQDAYRETGDTSKSTDVPTPTAPDAPATAALNARAAGLSVGARNFGIDVEGPKSRQLALGHWYPVRNLSGVYASLMEPQAVSDEMTAGDKGLINGLDSVEASSLVNLVAFDLSQFEVHYALGTDNPRLGWSGRAPRGNLPGPDGIDGSGPLVTNGMANPALLPRIVATFAGGFKREHGAFKWGDLAQVHHGSHYGFIEQGTIFSKLQPGLSTLYMLDDGSVHMETWTAESDRLLPHIQSARQNGVPLVELNGKGAPMPGRFVPNWGAGNWSGSADAKLRTLRAGACIVQSGGKQYLVHAVFSTATPSAMALTFQAYGCRYAMLLDMNALEHAYLALYVRSGDKLVVEHPINGMMDIDRGASGKLVPRFVGYPDNRDFFYLTRRKTTP